MRAKNSFVCIVCQKPKMPVVIGINGICLSCIETGQGLKEKDAEQIRRSRLMKTLLSRLEKNFNKNELRAFIEELKVIVGDTKKEE